MCRVTFRVTMTRALPDLPRHRVEVDRDRRCRTRDALRLLAQQFTDVAPAGSADPAPVSALHARQLRDPYRQPAHSASKGDATGRAVSRRGQGTAVLRGR